MWIFHSNTNSDGVRVTVVGAVKNGRLSMSAARCSSNDQFEKKLVVI